MDISGDILTVKPEAVRVVQDAESDQRLLDIAATAEVREGIRQGLEEAKRGEGRDLEEFLAAFDDTHGISS